MPTAEIPVRPYMLKNFVFTIKQNLDDDGADYAAAVPSCLFVPSQSMQTWRGGTEDAVFSDMTPPTWTCQMKLAQDYNNPASLFNFLFEHAGEQRTCLFIPNKQSGDDQFVLFANLILAMPPVGGDVDAWAEASVTHGVVGKPFRTL